MTEFYSIKEKLLNFVSEKPYICRDHNIKISIINNENIFGIVKLYDLALKRGDWFASEYSTIKNFAPNVEFFTWQMKRQDQIWFAFLNSEHNVIGATKLAFSNNGSIIIDETQLHPELGRRKGIMKRYFSNIIPILDELNLRYCAEFILTPESRSLRDALINEHGMYPTGIKFNFFFNKKKQKPVSCLLAYSPYCTVENIINNIMKTDLKSEKKEFLNALTGKKIFSKSFIKSTKIITAFDPFDKKFFYSNFMELNKSNLKFLDYEKSLKVKMLTKYFFDLKNNNRFDYHQFCR